MEFLRDNWFWIVLIAFFVWMRASGVGCCGSGRRSSEKNKSGAEGGEHQH